MTKDQLERDIKEFLHNPQATTEELNKIRTSIFDSFDNGDIVEKTKIKLLKSLYESATSKGLFFMKVMDRVRGLPKTEEDEESSYTEDEYEESYEESYSYEEDKEEEEQL